MDICGDNRFEIIERAKKHLLDATNIDTSADEMKVLDDFLYRCWQMGWLDRYDTADTPQNERSEFVKVSDRECPWCKAVCASTDKYCHECGWHIADTPQTEERTIQGTGDCEHCSRLFVDCDGR